MGRIEFALGKEREPHEYSRILGPALEELQTLARVIDELHGGTASVESRPGQCTTVVLRFPTPALAAA